MSLSEAETLVAAIFKVPSATAKRMVNSADARYSIELQHGLSGTARAPNPRRSPSAIATTLTPEVRGAKRRIPDYRRFRPGSLSTSRTIACKISWKPSTIARAPIITVPVVVGTSVRDA
jgi:hypothetical protein